MVEVEIDSIRVSLMSQHRIVILKDSRSARYLPIWIGPYEAEAITVSLQQMEVARPLTHDLLRNVLQSLGAEIQRVNITELKEDVFYARIVLSVNGEEVEIELTPLGRAGAGRPCPRPDLRRRIRHGRGLSRTRGHGRRRGP